MLKKWTLGMLLLSTSLFSQASLIIENVNSVDMVGITVTATFTDNSQETLSWQTLTSTNAGVSNGDWSLTLDGNTFGNYDDVNHIVVGEWIFTNISVTQGIIGLTINAGIEDYYFDFTRAFVGEYLGETADPYEIVKASYLDASSEINLFGTLDVNWAGYTLAEGKAFSFVTDTDKIEVPEPSTMFTFALGLIALTSLRKKSSGK